jgi:hypothetical protein
MISPQKIPIKTGELYMSKLHITHQKQWRSPTDDQILSQVMIKIQKKKQEIPSGNLT